VVGKGQIAKPTAKVPQRSKYGAVKTEGYASKKEAKRAAELKLRLHAGDIRNLREQVEFVLVPKSGKDRAVKYVADFCYEERIAPTAVLPHLDWQAVVEDAKGVRTPVYILKRRLMLHVHGVRIRET